MAEFIHIAPTRSLVALIGLEAEPERPWWRGEELGEILQHQLEAPLLFDLRGASRSVACFGDPSDADAPLASFGDLLSHPRPPLPLLELTKEFAKTSDTRATKPLPPEVATVLYYGAIVAALLRHGARISALGDRELREGVSWVLCQPWVEGDVRRLFLEGQRELAATAGL